MSLVSRQIWRDTIPYSKIFFDTRKWLSKKAKRHVPRTAKPKRNTLVVSFTIPRRVPCLAMILLSARIPLPLGATQPRLVPKASQPHFSALMGPITHLGQHNTPLHLKNSIKSYLSPHERETQFFIPKLYINSLSTTSLISYIILTLKIIIFLSFHHKHYHFYFLSSLQELSGHQIHP